MKLFLTLLLASLASLGMGQRTCNYPFVTFQSGDCRPAFETSVSDIVADGACNAAPSNGGSGPGPFYVATCDPSGDLLFFLSAGCSDAFCNSCRDNSLYLDNNSIQGWDVSSGDCNALNSFNSFRVIGTPTRAPSPVPTTPIPTLAPTNAPPTMSPTVSPTTSAPTVPPSVAPSPLPTTATPTLAPTTASPTFGPTVSPSSAPTDAPTVSPSSAPTDAPTYAPTVLPTAAPSPFPTAPAPTLAPTTASPTVSPTLAPTLAPTTASPTFSPTVSAAPTSSPTAAPVTAEPTASPTTSTPTSAPTEDNMCLEINKASCVSLMASVPVSTSCDCYSFCGEVFDQCFAYDVDGILNGDALTIGNSAENIIDIVCAEVNVAGCTDADRSTASPTRSPVEDPTTSPTRSPVDDPTASPTSPSIDGPSLAPSVNTDRSAPTSGATTWMLGLWSAVVGLGLAAFTY